MNVFERLFDLARQVLSESGIDRVLTVAMDGAIDATSAERGLIILFDKNQKTLFEAARNLNKTDIASPKFEISRTIIARVKKSGESICLSNALSDPSLTKSKSVARLNLLSVICIPLCHQEDCFGVVYLDNRRARNVFDSQQFQFAESFAELISLAAYQALERKNLQNRITALEEELRDRYDFEAIIGHHAKVVNVLKKISKVADSEATVLIQGETGTGKELVARALHDNSIRSHKPFVAVNCGALPETLMESELFGHVKGAFSDAIADRKGIFEYADGGTVFLDEVGDMPPSLQVKLLRILQSGEFLRLGSSETMRCQVRVVAATNKDLQQLVNIGSLRDDLYYRLKVIPISLPPLRERKTDLPILTRYFIQKYCHRMNKKMLRLARAAEAMLMDFDYPGNIRQLESFVQHAVTFAEKDTIEPEHLPDELRTTSGSAPRKTSTLQEAKIEVERTCIENYLRTTRGHISNAAKLAGVDASNFRKLMRKHGIEAEEYK